MINRADAPAISFFQQFEIKKATSLKLSNGVPIHYLQSGNQPIIRLEFIFNAGSWWEKNTGVSYITSKLLSQGTRSHTAQAIAEIIALHGAFIEVNHSFEHVNVTFYLMEKHLPELLPLISEIISHATFPQEELENLKTITNQTLKVNKEKTQFLASVEFRKAIFGPAHPYGMQYWEQDIDRITQQQVQTFANNYFEKGNVQLFICGHFDWEKLYPLMENHFGQTISKYMVPADKTELPDSSGNEVLLIDRPDALQSSIRYGKRMVNRNHSDFIGLLVVNEILGGYFGSRLMKNIREDKGYTYGIHSGLQSLVHDAYFAIATDVNKENTSLTLSEIKKEIKKLREEPVTDSELENVKSYMMGKFLNSVNTPFALMDKFKMVHFHGLDYTYYGKFMEGIKRIQPQEIMELSDKHLDTADFKQIVVGGM